MVLYRSILLNSPSTANAMNTPLSLIYFLLANLMMVTLL